jgi:rubrerythrin
VADADEMNISTSPTDMPTGLSVLERELFTHLSEHVEVTSGLTELYETLADTEHPYVQFLAQLIAEDEARHRRLFFGWLEAIRSMVEWNERSTAVPSVDSKPTSPQTISLLDTIIDCEKDDLRRSKRLRKEVADMAEATLWGVIVDMLITDAERHLRVLDFIRHHVDR